MAELHAEVSAMTPKRPSKADEARPLFGHVMACVEPSPDARRVLEHAVALAEQGHARLTALRVLPLQAAATQLADPVAWDLARREAVDWLRHLAEEAGVPDDARRTVIGGSPAASICTEARAAEVDLAVVSAGDQAGPTIRGLGATAWQVVETFPGSVLIVPPRLAVAQPGRKPARRVLALLDGSPQAEAASSLAAAIARGRGAELVLLHAVPEFRLGADGPPEPEDEALCTRLRRRSEAAARTRMERIRRQIPADALRSRVRLLAGEDPRRALSRAIAEEDGELVVLSARGLGGDPDLPIGSTAQYLIARALTPVLLVRTPERASQPNAGRAPRRPRTVHGYR